MEEREDILDVVNGFINNVCSIMGICVNKTSKEFKQMSYPPVMEQRVTDDNRNVPNVRIRSHVNSENMLEIASNPVANSTPRAQIRSNRTRRRTRARMSDVDLVPCQIIDLSEMETPPPARLRRHNSGPNIIQPEIVDLCSPNKETTKDSRISTEIPKPRTSSVDENNPPHSANCPVCMESVLQKQPTTTKCGHVFCRSCIHRAVRIQKKCPVCNARVQLTDLLRLYM